ncbi:hypothetical protein BpHYR1_053453 [Brachionus plicatilis]|uniref:Uncharacterized protein n=1 Tax=Brachionus plicatilis TaxID=10195 RepID=A0A3M7PDP0_BRAPC|nr:hypothetical protein BpHYR1_053453 [Brachionus plicatilis]
MGDLNNSKERERERLFYLDKYRFLCSLKSYVCSRFWGTPGLVRMAGTFFPPSCLIFGDPREFDCE